MSINFRVSAQSSVALQGIDGAPGGPAVLAEPGAGDTLRASLIVVTSNQIGAATGGAAQPAGTYIGFRRHGLRHGGVLGRGHLTPRPKGRGLRLRHKAQQWVVSGVALHGK